MLVSAPLVAQLHEPTMDGQPDENAAANCVPASLSSGLMALLPGQAFDGDELKDAVYGQGYTGATDPARFVGYCAAHGVQLTETQGTDPFALLRLAVVALDRHQPATLAIPSEWGSVTGAEIDAQGGPTHQVLLCDFDGVNLTAMNPEMAGVAGFQRMPLEWWASRLCYTRIFVMERISVSYHQNGDGSLTYPNGITLVMGIAAYVVANHIGATPLLKETYFNPNYSCVAFDDGTILSWDKSANRVRTDLGGQIIAGLAAQLAAVPTTSDAGDVLDDAAMAQAIHLLQAALAEQPAPAAPANSTTSAGAMETPPTITVQFGDTLAQICATYGVNAAQVAAANGITDPDALRVGQVLSLPAPAETAEESDAADGETS